MTAVALTELLGLPVFDADGKASGRVREVGLAPQEDRVHVSMLIVRTKSGDRVLPLASVAAINGGVRAATAASHWSPSDAAEGLLLLARDLLDQQVIDVHGRKVVRVNDIDMLQESHQNHLVLRVGSVDVGARGAVRRLLKGVVPMVALRPVLQHIPPRLIPWDFVDLIETDPARRVKLKISHERLATLHPADIADIVEDLTPNEREAVFETLDEGVAAEALRKSNRKFRKRSSSRSTPIASQTSSRKCNRMRPPICLASYQRSTLKRSSKRWSRKSGKKFPSSSNSKRPARPVA